MSSGADEPELSADVGRRAAVVRRGTRMFLRHQVDTDPQGHGSLGGELDKDVLDVLQIWEQAF